METAADGSTERDVIQSLGRGVAVLSAFDSGGPAMTLDELATASGISRSATRRLLLALSDAGVVAFDGHLFRPTARLLDLGYAQQSRLTFAEVAEPHCAELAESLGRTVSLARLDGDDVVYLVRVGSPRTLRVALAVGKRLPAYVPMIGRIQLAMLPDADMAQRLAAPGAQEYLARSGTTVAEYERELSSARQRGWMAGRGVVEPGLSAVAVPLSDRAGRTVAGLSVTTHAENPDEELGWTLPALQRAAERIRADLHPAHLA